MVFALTCKNNHKKYSFRLHSEPKTWSISSLQSTFWFCWKWSASDGKALRNVLGVCYLVSKNVSNSGTRTPHEQSLLRYEVHLSSLLAVSNENCWLQINGAAEEKYMKRLKSNQPSDDQPVLTIIKFRNMLMNTFQGGAVAEWSKVLPRRSNKRKPKDPSLCN